MSIDDALVMILAGGEGKRLYPLTKDRAKPAVPFGGRYRIIDFGLYFGNGLLFGGYIIFYCVVFSLFFIRKFLFC